MAVDFIIAACMSIGGVWLWRRSSRKYNESKNIEDRIAKVIETDLIKK